MGGGVSSVFSKLAFVSPAGGAYSSTNDLSRFISWILDPEAKSPVSKYLVKESLKSKFSFEDGNTAMGYPWEMRRYVADDFSYWSDGKDGNLNGFASSIEIIPSLNFGMVMLTNNAEMDAHYLTQPLVEIVAPVIRKLIASGLEENPSFPGDEFVGTYSNASFGSILIDSFSNSTSRMYVSNFLDSASGWIELAQIPAHAGWFVFLVEKLFPLLPNNTWSIETGCMPLLFNNVDGSQVKFVANRVYVPGMLGVSGYLTRQ